MQPFTYEVVMENLRAICEEMMVELRSICISTVIREAQDCATAITDASGRLISQSTGTPGHYNSIPNAVKGCLRVLGSSMIEDGDVIITNDPWISAGHMPDVVVMCPIFINSSLFGFSVTIAHHLDMGGKNPGNTTANTTDVFQDGLQIPPVTLVRAGTLNTALLAVILENVRLPEIVHHDLQCEIAVIRRGAARVKALCSKYGGQQVNECFGLALASAERLIREEIERIPDGQWTWTDYLDSDGQTPNPVKVSAQLSVRGSDIYVDFSDSAPQARGGINMTPSFRDSYTHMAIRCFMDPAIPHNEGCFAPVHITAKPGTVVSPVRPAPVAGRSVMISRVVDVVMACLSQACPDRAVAGYGGCNAQPVVSGRLPDSGRSYIFLDTNWGGLGAQGDRDGETCLSFPQNVANHPIEVLESSYPVQVERYEIRHDSEGAGRFRGGFGSVKDYRMLADAKVQVPGDRTRLPPFGLFSGQAACLTEYLLVRDETCSRLETKREYELQTGDVLSVRTPGGGGIGEPTARDPARVGEDVRLGFLSAERAQKVYGVSDGRSPIA